MLKNGVGRLMAKGRTMSSTTIDPAEIKHFKQFTTEWWDEMGIFRPLHSMNRLRVPFIRDGLFNSGAIGPEKANQPNCLENIKILDVGCGGGILCEPLARLGAQVHGLDANSNVIESAKKHAISSNLPSINYSSGSIEQHAETNSNTYDSIVASEVIEHINEKQIFLNACIKCLKPGGSIFLTTMNKTFLANILAICLAENVFNLVPPGTHEFDKFIEPHRVQRMLEEENCRTVLMHGLLYNMFTNEWSWTKDTTINYALHAIKINEI